MYPVNLSKATEERVRGMIEIRESVRRLISLQMDENGTDEAIKTEQEKLNRVYDEFYKKYGFEERPCEWDVAQGPGNLGLRGPKRSVEPGMFKMVRNGDNLKIE